VVPGTTLFELGTTSRGWFPPPMGGTASREPGSGLSNPGTTDGRNGVMKP